MMDNYATYWAVLLSSLFTGFAVIVWFFYFKNVAKVFAPIDLNCQSKDIGGGVRKSVHYSTKNKEEYLKFFFDNVQTLCDIIPRGLKLSNNGDCLGTLNKSKTAYNWISYQQVLNSCYNFGSGLRCLGFESEYIGIYSKNCSSYIIAEYSCYFYNLIPVPIYNSYSLETCIFVINEIATNCVLVDDQDKIDNLINHANKLKSLKTIISFEDTVSSDCKMKAKNIGVKIFSMFDIEILGSVLKTQIKKPKPEDVAIICYTSGTTATPKGVILTHQNIIANISSVTYHLGSLAPIKNDIIFSYLPLAHMLERCSQAGCLIEGAKIGFFDGNITHLSQNMKVLKPTLIVCVPRLFQKVQEKVYQSIEESIFKKVVFKIALWLKNIEINKNIVRTDGFWDRFVFKYIREALGGNIRLVLVGAAPVSPDLLNFMRCILGCVICEGYGQTECVCACSLTFPGDVEPGHVGPPLSSNDIKIIDVPEMDCFVAKGKGEIAIKGPTVFQGYFNNPELTEKVLDKEGWLLSGDIGEWKKNGTLRIIDRKYNIFKLQQGEFISPEKIENIYLKSNYIVSIFVYGDSYKSYLVGIVVPKFSNLQTWAKKNNITGTEKDWCKNEKLKNLIFEDLTNIGKSEHLLSFEQIKDIRVYPEVFSIENGLLTPTLKTKRAVCKQFFSQFIEDMYSKSI